MKYCKGVVRKDQIKKRIGEYMKAKIETDITGYVIEDADKISVTLKEGRTKTELEQRLIDYLFKKTEYTMEDVELIKLILKD